MAVETTPRFDLEGKIVLVTGATRGIGLACALACAGAGADLIVGARRPEDGEALTAEIERLGPPGPSGHPPHKGPTRERVRAPSR
jgi:NAD(P)-dependent dehydrogenase (short-subunit alcohol dehydrogenase family)